MNLGSKQNLNFDLARRVVGIQVFDPRGKLALCRIKDCSREARRNAVLMSIEPLPVKLGHFRIGRARLNVA